VRLSADDREELLETAEQSLGALSVLVANLLDVSRLQAGALGVNLRTVTLDTVVMESLDELGLAPGEVELDLASVAPITADDVLLRRVVVNLLANAIRFSPEGTAPVVSTSELGTAVQLRVIDRGPGIPPGRREDVFVPFQRLGDLDNSAGIGLGLALSKGFTEAMGGTLELEDTPGGGLTMVVELEAAP
jgi:two-component system sensor histidine kinase KdpD